MEVCADLPRLGEEASVFALASAPLSEAERNQIYQVIDGKSPHDSFSDTETAWRENVLDARVGLVNWGSGGKEQIIVQGTLPFFCGVTGNCNWWVFARANGNLRLVLQTGGSLFILKRTGKQGFPNLATSRHGSAFESGIDVYRWNGSVYEQSDCYSVAFDREGSTKLPAIIGCRRPQ